MAWFFIDEDPTGNEVEIFGEDALHIKKSLRMKQGETLSAVSSTGMEYTLKITDLTGEGVRTEILTKHLCRQEPCVKTVLYQALTKGDKMDFIVQKCVELGVEEIVPVITARCVSRPDEKTLKKKVLRWQKIALGAAMQSHRGAVPKVRDALSFKDAVSDAALQGVTLVFYELGGESLSSLVKKDEKRINIFVGCEGGFEESEVNEIIEKGGCAATLGKRILRAETAPLAALSAIMLITGNLE